MPRSPYTWWTGLKMQSGGANRANLAAMWTDVVDLNEFYRRPLGLVAQRMIERRVRQIWPNLRGSL